MNDRTARCIGDVAVISGFWVSVRWSRRLDIGYIHQTAQSEWDDAYTNLQVTRNDVEFAVTILGFFALVALTV